MDKVIEPVIVLLILSLISEKISNSIKLGYDSFFGKQNTSKEREKRVQCLSITIGLIVSLTCKANIFLFFKADFELFWTLADIDSDKIVSNIIGSIITGFFLSLGSKFFHDLLDILVEVKHLKKNLTQEKVEEIRKRVEDAKVVNEKLFGSIHEETNKFKQELINVKDVTSVSLKQDEEGVSFDVYVDNGFNTDNLIPTMLFCSDDKGAIHRIPTKVIKGHKPTSQGSLSPADKISNKNPYLNNTGSAGGVVYDTASLEPRLMTCYHVVKSPAHSWSNVNPIGNENVVKVTLTSEDCGELVKGKRNDKVDVALIKPNNQTTLSGSINGIGIPLFSRELNTNDKLYGTKLKMNGMTSGLSVGTVGDLNVPVELLYYKENSNQKEYHRINDTILVQSIGHNAFSKPGDSGSFVLDEYNYLIGMLVGGLGQLSYVIPIKSLLDSTSTQIRKP